jgi:DNA topoisomerase-1
LSRRKLDKERVLAAVVRLLDVTHVRIGNEEYARDNETFGLTTARNRHAQVGTSRVVLRYRGKGGAPCIVELSDPRLARIVARCQDLPGQRLFEWVDDEGRTHPVDSSDVNEYLQQTTDSDVTAKDFRTWAATLCAVRALERRGPLARRAQRERAVVQAVREAAESLSNTPAVCRRSYIHPEPLDSYLGGTLCDSLAWCRARPGTTRGLSADERMLRDLLRRQERRHR